MNQATSAHASGAATSEVAPFDAAYRTARRRVRMLRGWYLHALIYVCVVCGLWTIHAFTGHSRFNWPLPPTLGWGLGLSIHGFVVWLATSRKGRQWEDRKIEQYLHEELSNRSDRSI